MHILLGTRLTQIIHHTEEKEKKEREMLSINQKQNYVIFRYVYI